MKRLGVRLWILLGLSVPLFFLGAGRLALIDPDEPYYAVPALEMLKSGTWLVPVLHGEPWFDKPVLFYWVILVAYRILGVTEFAARIGSGLAALGGMLLLYAFGRNRGAEASQATWVSAIVLGTSLEFTLLGRAALTDMTLTFFLTAGMLAVARYLDTERAVWTALGGAAFGLACLTKGPVGVVLPVACLGAYVLLSRRTRLLHPSALASAAAGGLLTAAPWYLYMAVAHRDLLLKTFLGEENLGRFLHPEHQSQPLFYLVVLILGMLPWSGALPAVFFQTARASAWRPERERNVPADPLYLLCWFGGVLLVFSLSASKLLTYILPALPPLALLIGQYWTRELGAGRTPLGATAGAEGSASSLGSRAPARRGALLSATTGLILGSSLSLAALRTAARADWGIGLRTVAIMGGILTAGAVASWLAVLRSSFGAFLSAQACTTVCLVLIGVFIGGPQIESSRSARGLVAELRARGLLEEVVGAYGERGFSVDFYLGRTLPRAGSTKELRSLVQAKPGRIWVVPGRDVPVVEADRRVRAEPVATRPSYSAIRMFPGAGQ